MTLVDLALDALLIGDSTLGSLLGTFKGAPNVFLTTPLPPGIVPPYIAVPAPLSNSAHDSKTNPGKVYVRDIGCYTLATGDSTVVEAIAHRVWELTHRHPLTLSGGWHNNIIEASGPIVAPTDKTLYGRIVTVRLTLWKT